MSKIRYPDPSKLDAAPPCPIDLLVILAAKGGRIVSTNDLDHYEIAQAGADNRKLVLDDGTGFVWIPRDDKSTVDAIIDNSMAMKGDLHRHLSSMHGPPPGGRRYRGGP